MGRPFTLQAHAAAQSVTARQALHIDGSPANYWEIDEQTVTNMQLTLTPLDPSVPVFKEPHCAVTGTVEKVISETDGDHHIWLVFDGSSKSRLACEITPQQPIPVPAVGAHVRIYGIFRYDHQHAWWEIHPVDHIEEVA